MGETYPDMPDDTCTGVTEYGAEETNVGGWAMEKVPFEPKSEVINEGYDLELDVVCWCDETAEPGKSSSPPSPSLPTRKRRRSRSLAPLPSPLPTMKKMMKRT